MLFIPFPASCTDIFIGMQEWRDAAHPPAKEINRRPSLSACLVDDQYLLEEECAIALLL